MPARRSGLGRGLGALIPAQAGPASGADPGALREVPLARIRANQYQPRRHFDEESLTALVDSIRAVGILQPVLLRDAGDGEYELIAGERRCRAARRAGLQAVPALVQSASDASSLEQALIENLHRDDLNALEEAAAYKQLIEEFELTHEEVARRVGRSRAAVSNALRLLHLPTGVQRLVRDRALSAGHARALLGTPDRELQEQLARRASEEGLSVRAVEELVRGAVRVDEAQAEAWGSGGAVDDSAPAGRSPAAAAGLAAEVSAAAAATADATGSAAAYGGQGREPRPAPGERWPRPAAPAPARPAAATGRADPAPGAGTLRPPGVLELEELLADHLDTRVRVEMGGRHGRVVIEFATIEDLERIYRVMIGDRPG